MNERIKELARQAKPSPNLIWEDAELERFAELVRQDLIAMYKQALTDPENQPSQYGTVTVEYMEQQIALEREACAKLCESCHLRELKPVGEIRSVVWGGMAWTVCFISHKNLNLKTKLYALDEVTK
jgi:hypothetical protein